MGDEDKLRHELLDAARGVPPRTNVWKKGQGVDAYFSGAGSQNIWLMRFAVQALRGQVVPWEAVYHYQLGTPPGHHLVGRKGGVTLTPEILPDDRVYAPGFGGTEFLSTIYWGWHLMSHVALTRAEGEIAKQARRWVILNWVLFRAITAPDGSLMLFGQRSAGHAPFPREMDWIYALASGGDLKRAEKWCKIMGAGLRDSWEKEIALELQAELQATWKESLTIPTEALLSIPLRVPTEIVRTSEGIAVVHAHNCNPNTPPILAGTCNWLGLRVILPTSVDPDGNRVFGGVRIRQKFDHASARIDGAEIVYQSSLYTGGREIRILMPRGDVLYHLRLGTGEAAAPPSEPTPGTGTTEPVEPPPAPTSDLSRAADLLSSLKLAKKHQGEREAVVAAIRKGENPAPYLEIIRRWFRPDSPQAQATQWREALAILQENAQ